MMAQIDQLLHLLRPRWPEPWEQDPVVQQALERLTQDAREGHPSSLPYVHAGTGQIAWLSVAPTLRALREYLDDAQGWLQRVDARSLQGAIRQLSQAPGPLGATLSVVAPQGYARWNSDLMRGEQTLVRLGQMHEFLATKPDLTRDSTPSVAALRLEFISALRVGDWTRAEACVDEIDHWNLDHAPGTLQMRMRLMQARGLTHELFDFACATQAWNFANPRRIAAAIVCAVYACAIEPIEQSEGLEAAYELYRQHWHPKLYQCIRDAKGEPGAARPLAFAAAVDSDHPLFEALHGHVPEEFWQFLQGQMPARLGIQRATSPTTPPTTAATAFPRTPPTFSRAPPRESIGDESNSGRASSQNQPTRDESADGRPLEPQRMESASAGAGPEAEALPVPLGRAQSVQGQPEIFDASRAWDGDKFWEVLSRAVAQAHAARARALIGSLDNLLFDDPLFVRCAPDALLELVSDPQIERDTGARSLLYEVIAALVDAFVVAPGFPRLGHLDVYLALLDGIVLLKRGATSDADSQLVLGLVAAAANLRPDACARCEQIVSSWWQGRPVTQRLDWLAAALDSLGPLSANTEGLISLFTDALALAARKGLQFAPTKLSMWRAIGLMLELPAQDVQQYLAPLSAADTQAYQDALAMAGLRHIAVVSLRQASAKEAAKELQARTGARVSVVTSLVSDADTDQALSADLILYVWAASTHATYRSFDSCREKLEYVQGTGSSSIVLAAERWTQRHAMQ